jgi:hypothetical protein
VKGLDYSGPFELSAFLWKTLRIYNVKHFPKKDRALIVFLIGSWYNIFVVRIFKLTRKEKQYLKGAIK